MLSPPWFLQFSDSASISIAPLKTPDTEKSTNTNRLKRLSGDDVVLIASLSDDNDLAAGGVKEKESLTVKHVKKEKVSILMIVIIFARRFVVFTKLLP